MKLINSSHFTAVLDANVLFPVIIRDYLLWLAVYELYTPKWSSKLLQEFSNTLLKKNIPVEKVERQVHSLTEACPNALVTNYEGLIETIALPDENDRHVVAAAIKCNANVIVTYNSKDFPGDYLATFGLFVIDPDTFMADIIDLDPPKCCEAFKEMVLSKNKPPYTEKEYLEIFKSMNLEQSAFELEKYI